ncbi:MAG: hypothetical protein ACOCVF_03930 [bacterium]
MSFDKVKNIINQQENNKSFDDPSSSLFTKHLKKPINIFIKLGYINRINRKHLYKIKDIPEELNYTESIKLTKNIKFPRQLKYSAWSLLIIFINDHEINKNFTFGSDEIDNNITRTTLSNYINYLVSLKYIKRLDYSSSSSNYKYYVTIVKLKDIPDKLTVSLAQKMLFDNKYRRKSKIEKLRENINNI